jgi:Protein of unknown function (DUF3352)
MRRLLPFLVLTALLAGCGSASKTSSTGGSVPAGASLVRAGTLAFVSVDSDTGSDQWQQLDKLAQKFPGRDQAVTKLKQQLSQHGVDYEQDVKPALGPELDIAVVGVGGAGTGSSTKAVALTKPDDPAKFKALVTKLNASGSGSKVVYREKDGWYALSDSDRTISLALEGNAPLADDPGFKEAMAKLPGEALVKVFVDGQRLNAVAAQSGSSASSALGLDNLKYIAAAATAEDDGVRVSGTSNGASFGAGEFASALIGDVPGDAFAFLDFKGEGTTDQLEKLKSNPQVAPALKQLKQTLGVSLDQLLGLLSGEVAFYARPGAAIPELTLALDPKDESAALSTLDTMAARIAAMSGGRVESGTQGGHPVKTVNFGQFAIHYGSVGGKIVITSGLSGIADFGQGDHLADSADFKEAKDAAGMPDSTGGVVYIDLKDALPLIEGFAGLAGQSVPSSTTENLRPLRSFLAWTTVSGETRTFDAFLEIK